jgi:hypothetical protein
MLNKKPTPIPIKKSVIPTKNNSIITGRQAWKGGMKSRRLATRKNKKKTKTMRRNRRNL